MRDQGDRPPRRATASGKLRAAIVGLVAGLLVASLVTVVHARDYGQPALALLGSGDGLSVLVTTGDARLLVVGGSDPAAFANAFADARPRSHPRIDLLVELPDARAVASRAWALARPSAMLTLSTARRFPDDPPATAITAPITIDLPGGVAVTIDPGGGGDWSMRVAFGASTALITPAWGAAAGRADVALVVVAGRDASGPTTQPRASAVVAPAPSTGEAPQIGGDALVGLVAAGETVRLRVAGDGGLRIPGAWKRGGS